MHLTQAQKDALLAGASIIEVLAMNPETAGESSAMAEATALLAAQAGEGQSNEGQSNEGQSNGNSDGANPEDAAAAAAEVAASAADTIAKLEEANSKIEAMTAEATQAAAKIAELEAKLKTADENLVAINKTVEVAAQAVKPYVQTMATALSRNLPKDLSAADILGLHANLHADYVASFRTGRQSKGQTPAQPKPQAQVEDIKQTSWYNQAKTL